MSLLVKLEDDLGEHGEWVMLYGIIPANDDLDFPVLRCIDRFGRTVFNHLQMADFLKEWERVCDRARDESQKQSWQKIKEWPNSAAQIATSTFASWATDSPTAVPESAYSEWRMLEEARLPAPPFPRLRKAALGAEGRTISRGSAQADPDHM